MCFFLYSGGANWAPERSHLIQIFVIGGKNQHKDSYELCTMQANVGRGRHIKVTSYHNELHVSHIVCSFSFLQGRLLKKRDDLQNMNNKSADIFLTCQESERASFRAHQKLVSPFFQPPAIFSQICSAKSAESTAREGVSFKVRV